MKVWKLFFIYTRGKGKNPFFHFSDFPVFPKILKKEYIYKILNIPFTLHLVTTTHIQHRIPNICFPGLFFGDILLSFGDIIIFFGDILLSIGDIFVFFGDILLSIGVIFVLLISEIVIIWQVEEPIRYRPHQANLVTIRAKNNGLTLFNGKNQLIMKKLH